MPLDLDLIERWLGGRSLARGLPLPRHEGGGLRVDVDSAAEVRRHIFLDAGAALQACAARIDAPRIFLKAAVAPQVLRAALPAQWDIEAPGYLMQGPARMPGVPLLPADYHLTLHTEHGGHVARVLHASGAAAASGRLALHGGCAVFDQIVTEEAHQRRGLASAVMLTLDGLAARGGAGERLLVATPAGRALYARLGWRVLAPWATAVRR